MPITSMSPDEFLDFLKARQGEDSLRVFAGRLGVSPTHLSDVYNGNRLPGTTITSALNVQREVVRSVKYQVDTTNLDSKGETEL